MPCLSYASLLLGEVFCLEDEHGIPKRVEPVLLCDGLGIGLQDAFASGKSGDQDEQGRLWQMEIGDQAVDVLEGISWRDEYICQPVVDIRLKRPHGGGPDGDDPAAGGPCLVDGVQSFVRYIQPFFMHDMVFEVFSFYWTECPKPHVQGDACKMDTLLPQFFHQAWREMETGRWRGYGPDGFGIGRLVCRIVFFGGGDIGWGRDAADAVYPGEDVLRRRPKIDMDRAMGIILRFDSGDPAVAKDHLGPWLEPLPWFSKGDPMVLFWPQEKNLNGRCPDFGFQAGFEDLAFIDDQKVAWA